MKKTIFICDECDRQEFEERAVNWIHLAHPGGQMRFSGDDRPLHGLFCSIACLKRRIEQYENPKPLFAGGILTGKFINLPQLGEKALVEWNGETTPVYWTGVDWRPRWQESNQPSEPQTS